MVSPPSDAPLANIEDAVTNAVHRDSWTEVSYWNFYSFSIDSVLNICRHGLPLELVFRRPETQNRRHEL